MMISRTSTRSATICSSYQQRKVVRINEFLNQHVEFDNDLSAFEYESLWYSQKEFRAMKENRRSVLETAKALKSRSGSVSEWERQLSFSDCCLRGLEQHLPNGKSRAQQKREALRAIVTMYKQLKTACVSGNTTQHAASASELDEILRNFCTGKTRYAQHTANLLAVKDAAAAAEMSENRVSNASPCQSLQRPPGAARKAKTQNLATATSPVKRHLVPGRISMHASTA